MIGLEVYSNNHEDLARIEDISVGKDGQFRPSFFPSANIWA